MYRYTDAARVTFQCAPSHPFETSVLPVLREVRSPWSQLRRCLASWQYMPSSVWNLQELGSDCLENYFDSIDPRPIASASLAQGPCADSACHAVHGVLTRIGLHAVQSTERG